MAGIGTFEFELVALTLCYAANFDAPDNEFAVRIP